MNNSALTHINTNFILWIEVHDKKSARLISWKDGYPDRTVNRFFRKVTIKGVNPGWFEYNDLRYPISIDQIKASTNQYIVDEVNKICYEPPKVVIYVQSGESPHKDQILFKTVEEATTYAKEIADEIPHITVKMV